jgi:hypothetical protein
LGNLIKGERGLKLIRDSADDTEDSSKAEELKIIDMRDHDVKIYNSFDQMPQ